MLRDTRLRGAIAAAFGVSTLVAAADAGAQTWAGGRTTPSGQELVAVDATGELLWPHGFEDLAGDGDTFQQQEQSIDVRTAYAVTDAQRFWARIYVSDPNAPGGNIVGFVFIDGDDSPATGGSAAATDVHPGLTTDPTSGGWDAVLVIPGNGNPPTVWTWSEGPDRWEQTNPQASQVAAERGSDVDPIDIGLEPSQGYLQGSAVHGLLGIDQSCSARIYVRSLNDTPQGGGDVDVGAATDCTPPDANGDGVPDVAVPPQCDADDDCPFDGLCQNGICVLTELCDDATDCDANEDCSADGRCVARPGGTCEDDATCDSQLCVDGSCVTCTPGGTECGAGRRCGADGRCLAGDDPGAGVGTGAGGGGVDLAPGEEVQGGACTCDVIGAERGASGGAAAVAVALAFALGGARRRVGGRR